MKNNFSVLRFLDPEVKKEWKEVAVSLASDLQPQNVVCGAWQIDPETGVKQPVQLLLTAKNIASIMEVMNGNHA